MDRKRHRSLERSKKASPTALPHDHVSSFRSARQAYWWIAVFTGQALAVFLIYSNILHAPFVFDDVTFRDNSVLHAQSWSDLVQVLLDGSLERRIGAGGTEVTIRQSSTRRTI